MPWEALLPRGQRRKRFPRYDVQDSKTDFGKGSLPLLAEEMRVEQGVLLERLFMMERPSFGARSGGCGGSVAPEISSCH